MDFFSRTVKSTNSSNKNSKYFDLKEYAKETLGSNNIQLIIQLPKGERLNEWLAINIVDFYISL